MANPARTPSLGGSFSLSKALHQVGVEVLLSYVVQFGLELSGTVCSV